MGINKPINELTGINSASLVEGLQGPSGGGLPIFDFAAFFNGRGGFVFCGLPGYSGMFSNSAGTVPAVDLDPTGYVEDLSGNGDHAITLVSAERPQLVTRNGIRALAVGDYNAQELHYLTSPSTTGPTASVIAVHGPGNANPADAPIFQYGTPFPNVQARIDYYTSAGIARISHSYGDYGIAGQYIYNGSVRRFVIEWRIDGSNWGECQTHSSNVIPVSLVAGSVAYAYGAPLTGDLIIGSDLASNGCNFVPFLLKADWLLTEEERAIIYAFIDANFAGW